VKTQSRTKSEPHAPPFAEANATKDGPPDPNRNQLNREQKLVKLQKEDGKVFEAKDIAIDVRFLNPKYVLLKQGTAVPEEMGRINIFELRRKSGDGPFFSARWDGGSRDKGKDRADLDVDIYGVSKAEQRRFKNGANGYAGHHSNKIASTMGHTHEVSITTPKDNLIFSGVVSFSVLRKMGFQASTTPLGATIRRAAKR
jgi:hypothetical protein